MLQKGDFWEFPGGLVVRILGFHCLGPRFNHWSGNWDPASCTALPKKKKRWLFIVSVLYLNKKVKMKMCLKVLILCVVMSVCAHIYIAPFIQRSIYHPLNSGTKEPLFVNRNWSIPWPSEYTPMSLPSGRAVAVCLLSPTGQMAGVDVSHWSLSNRVAGLSLCLLCSTVIVFYVQTGPPFKVLKAAEVARNLHRRLSKEKADFLLFKVLRIDTAGMSPIRNILFYFYF